MAAMQEANPVADSEAASVDSSEAQAAEAGSRR